MQEIEDRDSCAAELHQHSVCANCDMRKCTYHSHMELKKVPGQCILGVKKQFCEAFFHIFPSPELKIEHHLTIDNTKNDQCRLQCVSMVVRLGKRDFICRYTNCRRIHCEQLMATDPLLHQALLKSKAKTLMIYLKFQPCHFSSGNPARFPDGYLFQGKSDERSCTNILIDFDARYIKPLGKRTEVAVANIYKADWQFKGFRKREDDLQTVQNAREGIQLLIKNGITLRGMTEKDWCFLAEQTFDVTYEHLMLQERIQADKGNEYFLQQCRDKGVKEEVYEEEVHDEEELCQEDGFNKQESYKQEPCKEEEPCKKENDKMPNEQQFRNHKRRLLELSISLAVDEDAHLLKNKFKKISTHLLKK